MFERWRVRRRHQRACAQWPDACLLVANGLRAGLSLVQAFELAAGEVPSPLGDELQRVCAAATMGGGIVAALVELEHRLPSEEVQTVVHAVAIMQTSGGNLATLFDRVVQLVREQRRVALRIRTLTAQGVMTAAIVAGVPFLHLGVVGLAMPQFVIPLFTTTVGRILLVAAVLLQALGLCWVRRIVKIRI